MHQADSIGVWGELVNHKRSLTHCPSSQDWAPKCPIHFVIVLYGCGVLGLDFLPYFSFSTLCSVLYTCIFMYIHLCKLIESVLGRLSYVHIGSILCGGRLHSIVYLPSQSSHHAPVSSCQQCLSSQQLLAG